MEIDKLLMKILVALSAISLFLTPALFGISPQIASISLSLSVLGAMGLTVVAVDYKNEKKKEDERKCTQEIIEQHECYVSSKQLQAEKDNEKNVKRINDFFNKIQEDKKQQKQSNNQKEEEQEREM